MRSVISFSLFLILALNLTAQSPQSISYQAVLRNPAGQLLSDKNVGVKVSILQGSASGNPVYAETHTATTNPNGLLSLGIGSGTPVTGSFAGIDWSQGPYFLKTETDPNGGTAYSITGTGQLLSVPYSLFALEAANGFSGDYNDLINKPVIDGSETKILAGPGVNLTGNGTTATPYVVSGSPQNRVILTNSQIWFVPANVHKIRIDLWGGSGGGGGAGTYSYSLRHGGDGGSGGYAMKEMIVTPNQPITVAIGNYGFAGSNAYYWYGSWVGDTHGSDGGDSWVDTFMKAAGGKGGRKGSFNSLNIHGSAGTDNIGDVTGYSEFPNNNILDILQGIPRSYIHDRVLTSRPGRGGTVSGYSVGSPTSPGEGGCAIITFLE